jgi:ABC-2 type transport system permease protein
MADRTAGSIYDLGYRRYTGPRLGRRHAIWVLLLHRLRACFGIGRPMSAKVFPIMLAVIAFLPAVVQLGVGALGARDANVIRPENYYRFVEVVLALFCAAVAPELVSRDQRSGTLSLYFSRALERTDYAIANFAALTAAMLALTLGPQAMLFVGNGLVVSNPASFLQDEWKQVPEIIGSALLLSALLAGIGVAIASYTPRRAYSTVSILAVFILCSTIGATLLSVSDQGITRYSLMISPFHVVAAFSFWFFSASPEPGSQIAKADLPGALYAFEALVVTALTLAIFVRRCNRIVA